MALSCYSSITNWAELEHHLNSEMSIFDVADDDQETEYFPDILGLNNHYHNSLNFSDSYTIDPLFVVPSYLDPLYPEGNYTNCSSSSSTLFPIFPPENEYEQQFSKRQKGYDDNNGMLLLSPSLCTGIGFDVPNPQSLLSLSPEVLPPFWSGSHPPVFSHGSGGGGGSESMNLKKGGGGSGSSSNSNNNNGGGGGGGGETLSAQSIAARQRRRKITEKTQELGKLIPGGQKMNTAEMFQAAFKYIKFLQAQVGILESMAASVNQDNEESLEYQELNPLLGCYLVQEKLYSMEKCLVPAQFVQSIAKDSLIQPKGRASLKDLEELMIGAG